MVPFSSNFPLVARVAVLAAGCLPATAQAGESRWAGPDVAQVRLVAAGTGQGGASWGALEFRMKPGWKVYWRSPGEAGRPPRADWSASLGLVVGPLVWPRPQLFRYAGLDTVGYKGGVMLPVRILPAGLAPKGGAGAATLAVDLAYQTCNHICIPGRARLVLQGPALIRPDPAVARRIAAAREAVPARLPDAAVTRLPDGRLRVAFPRPAGTAAARWRAPRLVVEAGPHSLIGLRPAARSGGRAVFEFVPPAHARRVGLLVIDGGWAGFAGLALP